MLALGFCAQAGLAHAQFTDDLGFSAPSSVVQGSGARALGMGGAFLARADDATAVSWNPAGLSYLARPELCVVGVHKGFAQSTTDRHSETLYAEDFQGTSPDFLSAAWPIRLGSTSGSVQVAYQRVLGFAGNRTWSKVPAGSVPGTIDETETINFASHSEGGFDTVSFAAGLRIARPIRIGVVINRWLNGFEETRQRLGDKRAVQQNVTFDLSGWNANLGVIVHPTENFNVGFVYKWPFEGDVVLSRRSREGDLPVAPVTGYPTLSFPAAAGVGLSWRLTSPLTVSADFTRSYWSQGHIYDYFDVARPPTTYPDLLYPTLLQAPPQENSDQWRFGVEYVLVGRKLSVPLRAGYYSDRQYFVDARGSAPRYDGVTVGAGVVFRGLLVDVAYVRQTGSYQDPDWVAQSGRAKVTTHQLYASLIYRFGSN